MTKLLFKFLFVFVRLGAIAAALALAYGYFFFGFRDPDLWFTHLTTKALTLVLEVFLPIFLTSLLITFSYTIKVDDLPKDAHQALDPSKTVFAAFFPIALGILANSLIALSVLPALEARVGHLEFYDQSITSLENQLDRDRRTIQATRDLFTHFPEGAPEAPHQGDAGHEAPAHDTPAGTPDHGAEPVMPSSKPGVLQLPFSPIPEIINRRINSLGLLLAMRPDDQFYLMEHYTAKLIRSEQELQRQFILPQESHEAEDMGRWTLDRLKAASQTFLEEGEFTRSNMAAALTLKGIYNLAQGSPEDRRALEARKKYFDGLKAEAEALLEESWRRSLVEKDSEDKRARASYFHRVGQSILAFNSGVFLEAYYGFLELSKEKPSDLEVAKYLKLSKEKAQETVVFKEIADQYFGMEGYKDLVFINPAGPGLEKDPYQMIKIGQLVETREGTYLKDIEVISFDRNTGKPVEGSHFLAPYGRIAPGPKNNQILEVNLEARELYKPSTDYLPLRIGSTGSSPYFLPQTGSPSAPAPKLKMDMTLRVSLLDLELVTHKTRSLRPLGLGDLYYQAQTLRSLGHSSLPLEVEFMSRILTSLEIFILSFWTLFLGWILRTRQTRHRWIQGVLLIITLPPVIWFLLEIFHWVARLGSGLLVLLFGLWTSTAILAVLVLPLGILGVFLFWRRLRLG